MSTFILTGGVNETAFRIGLTCTETELRVIVSALKRTYNNLKCMQVIDS